MRDWLWEWLAVKCSAAMESGESGIAPLATEKLPTLCGRRRIELWMYRWPNSLHHTAQWCTNAMMLRACNKQNSFSKFFELSVPIWHARCYTVHRTQFIISTVTDIEAKRYDAVQTKINEIANWNRHDNTETMEHGGNKRNIWVWFKTHLSGSVNEFFCESQFTIGWPSEAIVWYRNSWSLNSEPHLKTNIGQNDNVSSCVEVSIFKLKWICLYDFTVVAS